MYMKFISYCVLLWLSVAVLSAQISIERQVIGAAGGYSSTPNLKISDTAGEVAVTTVISGTVILTQGFQQAGENEITDLEDLAIEVSYKVYPNPTTDQLFVEITRDQFAEIYLELFDMAGRSFPNLKQVQQGSGFTRTSLSLQNLPEGTYLLSLKGADGRVLASHRIQKIP